METTTQNTATNTPSNSEPVKTGDWVLTMLIMAIPIVGFVMLFVWAFGSGTKPSKANWAKASLIWMLIAVGFYAILFASFGVAFFTGFFS